MGLETGTFIDDFVTTNPTGSDVRAQGDDHLRLIKLLLKNTFPNATRAFYFPEAPAAKTADYTVVASDANSLIGVDASAGTLVITLPLLSSVFEGFEVSVVKVDAVLNSVTVSGSGSERINGANTHPLANQHSMETYRSDGSAWKVVSALGLLMAFDQGVDEGPIYDLYRDSSNPADFDFLGVVVFSGRDSSANKTTYAKIRAQIVDATQGTGDGRILFGTRVAGTLGDRMRIQAGVYHGNATGGDKGDNTINFGAVYDDNVLLTCYVFDQFLDGRINLAKWDNLVPDAPDEIRTHGDARKFISRAGTASDPLDIDKYAAHWQNKRHLTSMPNEATFNPEVGLPTGAWIQRLLETVEIQAIHIEQLNQRVKKLESATVV